MELGLRLKRHVVDLLLVVVVLGADVFDFKISVLMDLLQNLLVLLRNRANFALHLVNRSVLDLDLLAVGLLLLLDLVKMLFLGLIKRVLVHETLLFLLHLELVETAGVFKHLLRVFVTFLLDDLLLTVKKVLALVFVVVLGFFLVLLE